MEKTRYADVLLPLAAGECFTYRIPSGLEGRIREGSRVVVPFGKRKFYTGIVVRTGAAAPPPEITVKDVAEAADGAPILLPPQLDFWHWMASYYMCTPGEVMKAALPSGLKLESETMVVLDAETDPESVPLTPREQDVAALLSADKARDIASLQKAAGGGPVLTAVRGLVEKGVARVHEALNRTFRPRYEIRVRLTSAYADAARIEALFGEFRKAQKQEALLLAYLDLSRASTALTLANPSLLEEVTRRDLMARLPGGEAALASLCRKGILETYRCEVGRLKPAGMPDGRLLRPLSGAQQTAFDGIGEAFRKKEVCLLHGVTSSGKTEVYMHLIQQELEAGRQVLYLLPEIALTTQITTRLGRVFGDRMGVYHSKFPDAERVELWQRQLTEKAFPLILGVRSSLFLPFRRLGLIIVDEEHEMSYKQQDPAPRYNARDAAIVLARLAGAKVLLGTATPSLETYSNALSGKYGKVELTTRYGNVQLPEVCVEDIKELRRKKLMKTPFSPRLIQEIKVALDDGGQVILFQNRRGYSPVVECRSCGWTPRCKCCDVSLTLHRRMNKMVCHYCGAAYDIPNLCPACGDTELRDMGYGTEKIEEAVQTCFPTARTARMDLDTTRSRSSYERILSDFQHGATDILIGTQMVTKGLDFDRVRVVGILCADQMLGIPDFRAYERAYQMMAQVAGRAGRRGRRGLVVVQTRQPDLPLIRQVTENNYAAMYGAQMVEREMFGYPPHVRIIGIYLKHRDERAVETAARSLENMLRPHFGTLLLGPDRPPVGRIQLQYIRKMMLKIPPSLPAAGVRRTLNAARSLLLARPEGKGVTLFFDVDPM